MSASSHMTSLDRRSVLTPLINLAARSLPTLPTAERADIYEAIAMIASEIGKDQMATIATAAAAALRDAETHQLTFSTLFGD